MTETNRPNQLKMLRRAAWAAAATFALATGGMLAWRTFGPASGPVARVTGEALIASDFVLTDHTGRRVTEADFAGRWQLVFFGYTYCPDICPTDNARNAEAIDLLAAEGHDVGMALISIDPERDTPEQLRDFTDYLHPDAVGYTGTAQQIRDAANAYKAYFKKEEDADPDFYLVDHSTFTYLMLPETGFAEFFRREVTPDEMAERVGCFVDMAGF